MRFRRWVSKIFSSCSATLLLVSCSDSPSFRTVLTAEMPIHLEEHLDAAGVVTAPVPEDMPVALEWRFDQPQPAWKALDHYNPSIPPPRLEYVDDALRVSLDRSHQDPRQNRLHADIYVQLPELRRADWSHLLIRARASEEVTNVVLGYNLEPLDSLPEGGGPSRIYGDNAPIVNDGTVQTYRLRADWSPRWLGEWRDPWRQLVIAVSARGPSSLDLLSVTLVPKAATYAEATFGVRSLERGNARRRAVYVHAPARLEYRVRVPESGRLDLGLGVLAEDQPVTFRVSTSAGSESEIHLEESYSEQDRWAQRSVDLTHLAGRAVTLVLEADAERDGEVAFWAAPTLSGSTQLSRREGSNTTNVIFYVIDGGGADYMSLYGYNRRTTPFIDKLAREGAVFEYAYSNSSWSKPSTTSFMTSLQNSVLGNTRGRFDPLPEEAITMAEQFHDAGYQTAVFTTNPWAASMSSLDRGADVTRDQGAENDATSSVELQQDFWTWREAYPGAPYWVHFQTTDVHDAGEYPAVAGFSGLFVSPEQKKMWMEWHDRLDDAGGHGIYSEAFEATGISRVEFFTRQQGLYDESLAHNDYQLGRLVERLKAIGEWENTLLIIGADHSIRAAMDDMGIAIRDSLPPRWSSPIFRPSIGRVPLVFVWPGHIDGGQRFSEPVSMIDVLPTVLDLVGLPQPEAKQGRSLAPLLLGTGNIESRPVIFDEFWRQRSYGQSLPTRELQGTIEVVDGRWGASLWIGPEAEEEERRRPTALLLYDLWNDPMCLRPVNEEHPNLVEKYTTFLEEQWKAHQALAQHFTAGGDVELTSEQLETLRTLGYIQ